MPLALTAAGLPGPRRLVAVAGLAFTLAQTGALIASPVDTIPPFVHPGSPPHVNGLLMSGADVRAVAAAARRCPPGAPFSGQPFLAFVARRPMPAGQPDQFLPAHSGTLRSVEARIVADSQRCP